MSTRYLARVAATFLARSQSTALLTDYVTRTGVFVRTDLPPQRMQLLRIEFILPPDSTEVVLHGMVTQQVAPSEKHAAPGVEIAFFAKEGDESGRWDRFIAHLSEKYPESLRQPVMLARGATDQVRRAHPRRVPASVLHVGAAGAEAFTVGDISDGGMFIRTEDGFVVGSDLRVTLLHPRTHAKIPLDCVVRRRALGANTGIGVEFRNMDDVQRRALRELMQAAGATHPVRAHCEEILAPAVHRTMETLPGHGTFGGKASIPPAEDSWAGLEEGWPSL